MNNQTINGEPESIARVGSSDGLCHDHACHCGTAEPTPHETGTNGCVRTMTEAPEKLQNDYWRVDGHDITGYSLRDQRLYHQHPCGCWSKAPGSTNSIEA